MSDEVAKACVEWFGNHWYEDIAKGGALLSAFVREQVEKARLEGVNARPLLDRITALEAEYGHSADVCNRYAEEINSQKDRIEALEAERDELMTLLRRVKEMSDTQFAALEACLEMADRFGDLVGGHRHNGSCALGDGRLEGVCLFCDAFSDFCAARAKTRPTPRGGG